MDYPKPGIVIKESPLYDNSDSTASRSKRETNLDVMFVIMADVTAEATMEKMERKINFMMNVVKE